MKDTDGNYASDLLFNGVNYTTLDASQISLSAVAASADFGSGAVSGSQLEIAVVPEPQTWVMIFAGLGLLAFSQRIRRLA